MTALSKRRKAVLAVAVVSAASLLLSACGGSSGGGGGASTASGSGGASSSGSGSGSAGGGSKSVTVSVPALPTTLSTAQGVISIFSGEGFMSTLVDYAPQPKGATTLNTTALIPSLATSWKRTPQGEVFTLRPAKASNGDVLTAADVKYTYDRYVATKDGLAEFLMSYGGVSTTNPVTVINNNTVRLNGNIGPLGQLAWQFYYFTILDSKVMKAHSTTADPWGTKYLDAHSASFGPYDVASFQTGSQLILQANPNYWGPKPAYSKVTVLGRTQGASASQLLTSGSVQWATWASPQDYTQLKSNSKFQTYVAPQITQDVLELSQSYAPFKDPKVREAMSLATNRAALVTGAYGGVGKPATTVGSAAIPALAGVKGDYYTYDLDKAKQLMKESGYPNGFTFSMAYSPGQADADGKTVALTLQSFWQDLGIKVTAQPVNDPAQFAAAQAKGSYQSYYWGEGPILADGAYMMGLYHVKGGLSNFTGESDPAINALVTKAAATPLGAARDALVKQAATMWNAEMFDIPMVDTEQPYIATTAVCGFATYPYQNVLYRDMKPC
jgi:peptide/nickel transport system substrate-binding protein